jgi:hypothetical protein
MSSNQSELFREFPRDVNPSSDFASFRVGKNIIHVPLSKWKDGRLRGDLSAQDAGEVVSRNEKNFREKVIRRLQEKFNTAIVEVVSDVSEELERERGRPGKQRLRKKDLADAFARQPGIDLIYANPFAVGGDNLRFARYPDWLLARQDLKDQEKLIYGRLLFPLPPICELGKSLGKSRQWANHWLVKLQAERWIECTGPPGAKKDKLTRFFWKEGMPETCHAVRQVLAAKPDTHHDSTCHTSEQRPATQCGSTCHAVQQVSQSLEKRDFKKNERRNLSSPVW